MTGPEHYTTAEHLLRRAEQSFPTEDPADPHPQSASMVEQAQIHATLALVAVTAEAGGLTDRGGFPNMAVPWEVVR